MYYVLHFFFLFLITSSIPLLNILILCEQVFGLDMRSVLDLSGLRADEKKILKLR
jgi:hypothetical protein